MEIINYAFSRQKEIILKTEVFSVLLKKLGNPHCEGKYIHITGTNGKGSVASFTEAILMKANLNVCRYSSPHLITPEDSLCFNGTPISRGELEALISEINPAAEETEKICGKFPSRFEIITAAAFMYFKIKNPDFIILEVGMGGEGDATNVIPSPVISVITPISVDHTAYLGSTPEEIAKKKSAIIKKGCRVVSGIQPADALAVLKSKAELEKAEFIIASPFPERGFSDIYESVNINGENIFLSLGGMAQLENSAIAVEIAKKLCIRDEYIAGGLQSAVHPARFEKIKEGLYFDGAHNVSGATALRKSLDRYFPDTPISFVMGVMKDKDYSAMLEILNREGDTFTFVPFKDNDRAELPENLLCTCRKSGIKGKTASSFPEAISGNALTVVCGSLYLYKDFSEELT